VISYANAEEALAFWDMIDDDSAVFVPVVMGEGNEANAIYIEAQKNPDKSIIHFLRVFINEDEADSYKLSKKSRKVTVAKTTIGHLVSSLHSNWGSRIDKKIDCVLSTIDISGKICSIETLWSNKSQPN